MKNKCPACGSIEFSVYKVAPGEFESGPPYPPYTIELVCRKCGCLYLDGKSLQEWNTYVKEKWSY